MGQKRFLMSQKELQRYHVISKAVEGRMTALEAAESLNLSTRQVFRLKAKVMAYGPEGVIHSNRGRQPVTTKPEGLMKKIRDLIRKYIRVLI